MHVAASFMQQLSFLSFWHACWTPHSLCRFAAAPADDLLAGHLLAQHLQRLPAPRGMRLGAICQDGARRHGVHPAQLRKESPLSLSCALQPG